MPDRETMIRALQVVIAHLNAALGDLERGDPRGAFASFKFARPLFVAVDEQIRTAVVALGERDR